MQDLCLQASTGASIPFSFCTGHIRKSGTRVRFVTLVFPDSLQVSVLEDLTVPGRKVCVANTHLYWHPKGMPTLDLFRRLGR